MKKFLVLAALIIVSGMAFALTPENSMKKLALKPTEVSAAFDADSSQHPKKLKPKSTKSEDWESLGEGKFRDIFFSTFYQWGDPFEEISVEIEQNVSDPTKYRLVDMYKNYDYSELAGAYWFEPGENYVYIDTYTTPEGKTVWWIEGEGNTGMYCDATATGLPGGSISLIWFGIKSIEKEGIETMYEKNPTLFGIFENGIFTCPAKPYGMTNDYGDEINGIIMLHLSNQEEGYGYFTNKTGNFAITLPKATMPEPVNPFENYTYIGECDMFNSIMDNLFEEYTAKVAKVQVYEDHKGQFHIKNAWLSGGWNTAEQAKTIDFSIDLTDPNFGLIDMQSIGYFDKEFQSEVNVLSKSAGMIYYIQDRMTKEQFMALDGFNEMNVYFDVTNKRIVIPGFSIWYYFPDLTWESELYGMLLSAEGSFKDSYIQLPDSYIIDGVEEPKEILFKYDTDEFVVTPGNIDTLCLSLDGYEAVNGFQLDVELPEGMAIADNSGKLQVSFGKGTAKPSHILNASKVEGVNTYRIIAYSSKNEAFAAGAGLLNINISVPEDFIKGSINIKDITLSKTNGEGVEVPDIAINAKMAIALSIGNDVTVEQYRTLQLTPVTTPAVEGLTFEWATTNSEIAYVDTDNVLHALTPGEVVITASNSKYDISASIKVTVIDILYGDSNDNGIVSIDDVVTDVQYILELDPQPFSFVKADVNCDEKLNIIDVSKTVGIVLTNETKPEQRALRNHLCGVANSGVSLSSDDIQINADGHAVMTILLNGDVDITALQGDIRLPEGVHVSNISMAEEQKGDHIVSFAELKSGITRFAVYSMSLAGVTPDSALIKVELESDSTFIEGDATVDEIYVSDTNCNLLKMEGLTVTVSGSSSVTDIFNDANASADVYNIQGVLLIRNASQSDINALAPGLYIIGGNKVQIR